MKLLVLNGPNLNLLGIREPEIYGKKTYADLVCAVKKECRRRGIGVKILQSNSEAVLVTMIQKAYKKYDGLIFNPAAYTHTSVALLDAIKAVGIPTVEVHLSEVSKREEFRKISYVGLAAKKTIAGKGIDGYLEAVAYFDSVTSGALKS
ncbi:MAG: 3-dehydroquinate dehydratase [Ruminococcaceae bacterium]|nr:3-dehydroquinate dehydratase [Oscillospiraceae bacterium]